MQSGPLENGIVSWYSAAWGFGFITPAGGGVDVVVYAETLTAAGIETLAEGDAVSFESVPERRARRAVRVERARSRE